MSKFRVVFNVLLYCTGSVLFIVGSLFYYPEANQGADSIRFVIGAILYLIGASMFLLASSVDWILVHYHQGLFFIDYSVLYILGSVLYVIGCVNYIPALDSADLGSYLFILGSLFFIFPSIYEIRQSSLRKPSISAIGICSSISLKIGTAIFTGTGAMLFLVGAVMFLNIENDGDLVLATSVFLIGSIVFTVSSVLFSVDMYRTNWPSKLSKPADALRDAACISAP